MPPTTTKPTPEAATPEPSWAEQLDAALSAVDLPESSQPEAPEPPAAKAEPEPPAKAAAAPEPPASFPKIPSVAKAPKADAASTDAEEVPVGLDAKAGAKWKEIRGEARAAADRATAAEARAKELEEKLSGFNPDEIKTLKEQTTKYEQALAVTNVRATRQFSEAVEAPKTAILDAAKILAAKYEVAEGAVLKALTEPDPNVQGDLLTALGETWNARDQGRLFRMGDDLLVLAEKEKFIVSNAAESLARIRAQEGEQLKALETGRKTEWTTSLDAVWDTMKGESPFFDTAQEGIDPDHKAAIDKATSVARGVDFDTLPAPGKAYAAYTGAVFPYLMQVVGGLQQQLTQRDAELARYRGTQPGAGAGGGDDHGAPAEEGNDWLSSVNAALERSAR